MKIFMALAFLFYVIGILCIFKINTESVKELSKSFNKKDPSLKQMASPKKKTKLEIFMQNIILSLETMGQLNNLYYLFLISFFLIIMGAFAGISFGNPILSFVFAMILASTPFIFVRVQYVEYKALLFDEMETGLSVITSSIERTDNIVEAFHENIQNINKPLHDVFAQFIYSVEHNTPMTTAIEVMKSKINNKIFNDWCDALKNVSRNRMLKYSLRPIVYRIGDIKIASAEAKTILLEANSEFKFVTGLSVIFMIMNFLIAPKVMESLGVIISKNLISTLLAINIVIMFTSCVRTFILTRDVNFEEDV